MLGDLVTGSRPSLKSEQTLLRAMAAPLLPRAHSCGQEGVGKAARVLTLRQSGGSRTSLSYAVRVVTTMLFSVNACSATHALNACSQFVSDFPNEFFFNESTRRLYYVANTTDSPGDAVHGLADGLDRSLSQPQFVATQTQTLFNLSGSSGPSTGSGSSGPSTGSGSSGPSTGRAPDVKAKTLVTKVVNVKLRGLEMRDTAHTFLEPHGLPSAGDWALQHTGAVTMRDVEEVTVEVRRSLALLPRPAPSSCPLALPPRPAPSPCPLALPPRPAPFAPAPSPNRCVHRPL
jgi:hypothetical protein